MPTKLKKLLVDRVDLVDTGANPDAHIMMFKSDDESGKGVMERFKVWLDDVAKAGRMISDANMKRLMAAMDAIKSVLTAAGADKEPDEGEKGSGPMGKSLEDILKGLTPEDAVVVEGSIADARKAAAKPDDKPQTIDKSALSEELRKQFEDMEKKAADAEKIAKESQEKLAVAEFTKRAEAYPTVPGTVAEKGDLLRKAYGISEEYGAKLEATWKAMSAQLDQNNVLLKELGRAGADTSDSPTGKLESMAKAYSTENKVSFEDAYDAVLKTDAGKALYAEMGKR